MSRQDLILGTIRTAVPAGVGWLLAWAIAQIPAIADWIAAADLLLAQSAPGTTIAVLLNAAAIAAAVGLYYWIARRLGAKWPALERWLLGSSTTPTYFGGSDRQRDAVLAAQAPLTTLERETDAQAALSRVESRGRHEA